MEKLIDVNKLARRIAGHSDYHGDNILSAIYCMAKGQVTDVPIAPIKRKGRKTPFEIYKPIEEVIAILKGE